MDLAKLAAKETARLNKKYGHKTGALGSAKYHFNVVPTGSLALDYALGTGGWPLGHPVEIFGAEDIGKSSIIGFNAIRNAQAKGMLCGIIAMEPNFDKEWAIKNGVDPKSVIIARPDSGEQAFDILYDWIVDDVIDFVVFDSIGAVVTESELAQDSIKSRVGGQSKLITDGVKRILIPTWKNNKGVIFLNQQRDNMQSRIPGQVESPGGKALKHSCAIRVHLRQQGKEIKENIDGDQVTVGRSLVAIIKRNKLSEGSNKRAEFDYCLMETENSSIGIDVAKDVIATGMRTGVIITKGSWYVHHTFPGKKTQILSKDRVGKYLTENPASLEQIRSEVLAVMVQKVGEVKQVGPNEPDEEEPEEDEVVDGS